jgi:hypothetical protein
MLQVIWKAMHLFMSSRMIEAEDICLSGCDHRLYYSVGFALIQSIKSLATFEPEDLEAAIQCCRDSILIAQLLRKKDHGLFESVGRIAKGSTSVHSIKSMTSVQRHAELVYSECTLLKVSFLGRCSFALSFARLISLLLCRLYSVSSTRETLWLVRPPRSLLLVASDG